ncbi:amidohydrolase [Pseudonocardia sp. ICBG1122]|nr:amidohydrolase [Pseudonocardia pini]
MKHDATTVAKQQSERQRIDVHAHWFPPELLAVAERLIDADLARTTAGRALGTDLDLAGMIQQLDTAGIDRQVLSPANVLPFAEDLDDARCAARETNDLYADLVHRAPRRYAFFGVVPLPHVDPALAETARCLDELGAVGLALGCSVVGRELDDPAFEPLWRELDRRAAVVFLHPVGRTGDALRAYNLNWVVGAPFEDTLAVLRLVLSGITTRHPAIRFVVPHMGGTIPFLLTRIDRATSVVARSPDVAVELPVSRHLGAFVFDTSNRNPHALRCAADVLGPERLVLGSDFPYSLDAALRENVTYVAEVLGDTPATDDVLGGTAGRLLGL